MRDGSAAWMGVRGRFFVISAIAAKQAIAYVASPERFLEETAYLSQAFFARNPHPPY